MDGKESVLQKFDTHSDKLVHWKMYYGYAPVPGQLCDSTETFKGELDKDLSRKRLVEALELLPPDDYLIQFKPAPTSNNNIISHRFRIGRVESTQVERVNPAVMKGYVSADYMNERINNALLNRDLEDLKKDLKDLKDKKDGGFKEIAGELIKQGLPMLMGYLKGARQLEPRPQVVRGPQTEDKVAERKTFFLNLNKEATEGLYCEEDFGTMHPSEYGIVVLWCLNEWRKENPEMFATLKPTLTVYADKLDEGGSNDA